MAPARLRFGLLCGALYALAAASPCAAPAQRNQDAGPASKTGKPSTPKKGAAQNKKAAAPARRTTRRVKRRKPTRHELLRLKQRPPKHLHIDGPVDLSRKRRARSRPPKRR